MQIIERARERLFANLKGKPLDLKSADEQTENDKALVSFVRSKLEEVRTGGARIAQEGINLTNIAYLCGFDSIYFDTQVRTFKPLPSPSAFIRRNRVHVNRILPTVQNRLARLVKTPPRYDIKPKSSDEGDKDAARLGLQVLEQLWESLQVNRKRIPLVMWLQECGIAYFKVSWDPSLGEKRVLPVDKLNEDGSITRSYDVIHEGDVRIDVASFFEVFPDPLAKSWDELKHLVHAKIRKLDYFKDQYPDKGHLVKEEDCWLNSLQYESRINAINSATGSTGSSAVQMKDCAIEMAYYEKPSVKHPYGRHIICANGVLLKDDVLPIDELPWVKFDDIVVGGKFNAEAVITHLRPLQDQINKTKSMRAAWTNRMLTGKIIAPRSSNIAAEAFNDQSGELLKYDHVQGMPEPKSFDMPAIPQYAYQEEEVAKEDINDTAGINQVARGQLPSASIPAIGMQLLVEQDDTRIGVETESHEYSYADLGRIILKFVGDYYKTERLLKIAGENMEYTVRKFKGEDLRDNYDVTVIRGSTLPGSKVLKRQEIINVYQMGLFGNPQDPLVQQNVMSMLEWGDEYQAWERQALRRAQVQRGLTSIEENGIMPPVSEFDDHPLWIQKFDDFRVSEKFSKLPEDRQLMILQVMNAHLEFAQEQVAPKTMEDPNLDPKLRSTTAAQDHESELLAQAPPESAEPILEGA